MATKKTFAIEEDKIEVENISNISIEKYEELKKQLEETQAQLNGKKRVKKERNGEEPVKARILLSRFNNKFSLKQGIIFGHNGKDHYVAFGEESVLPWGVIQSMDRHIEANTKQEPNTGVITNDNVHYQYIIIEKIYADGSVE